MLIKIDTTVMTILLILILSVLVVLISLGNLFIVRNEEPEPKGQYLLLLCIGTILTILCTVVLLYT